MQYPGKRLSVSHACLCLLIAVTFTRSIAFAQTQVSPLVSGVVDETHRVTLSGNVYPLAQSRYDQGAVEDSFAADGLYLILKRSLLQERALQKFLQESQDPASSNYHKWLTPQQFGQQYGATDSDIAAVTSWLQSHGFTVGKVHPGRIAIEFSGNAAQLRAAFHTEIHRYQINTGKPQSNTLAAVSRQSETQYANATDPQIPAALAPLIAGVSPMHSFHALPQVKVAGKTIYNVKTHQAKPAWSYPQANGAVAFELSPADFAVQYDINPVYTAGTTGTGQSIGILSASNIDLSLVQAYRQLFGLPANLPHVVVEGNDPGMNDAATEAYLDVEMAGSVAPGATVVLYTSAGTVLTEPVFQSGLRALEDNTVSVLSVSYLSCEAALGASGNLMWSKLWQEAAAQGITGFVSAGDGGSAGCDDFDSQGYAYSGLAVNGLGSTPYNVSVGGTDFYYSSYAQGATAINTQLGSYWNLTGTTSPTVSLKQPIPEQVWNGAFGLNTTSNGSYANVLSASGSTILAGGGGRSTAAIVTNGVASGYAKPTWQVAPGVPSDKLRDVPDLSLYAANGDNSSYYPICANAGDCTTSAGTGAVYITSAAGTSASSPAMAGIQALVNQATRSSQGQADFVYYALANRTATANSFHDVTVGGNEVPCLAGTSYCFLGTAGQTRGYYAEGGFYATPGYDSASGLGSVDVARLIANWPTVVFRPTSTTLSITPTTFAHGSAVSVKSTVAPKTGTGTPAGSIALDSNDPTAGANGLAVLTLSGGTVSSSINDLPGGTYQVVASYSGDGAYAASTSAPVTVTVAPEADTLQVAGWALNPLDGYLYPLQAGMYLPYGSQIYLDAQPVGVNEAQSSLASATPASGSIVFTDKLGAGVRVTSVPLNSAGVSEWQAQGLGVGTHTIVASYPGDASYAASSAPNAASLTIFRGTTTMSVTPLETSVASGSSVTVDIQLHAAYLPLTGTLPTGNVVVTLGGQVLVAAWKSYGTTGQTTEEAVVTFTQVPPGILPLSASYAGDANWLGTAATYGSITSMAPLPAPAVTLTAPLVSFTPGQSVTVIGTVTGKSGQPVPTGKLTFTWADGSASSSYPLLAGTASATYTWTFPASQLINGSNAVIATYQGDAHYSAQSSSPLILVLNGSDFSLTTLAAELPVAIGRSATVTAMILPVNGYSAAVALTCASPAGITCAPANAAPVVGNGTSDVVTVTAAGSVAAGIYPVVLTASGGGHIHTAQVLVAVH